MAQCTSAGWMWDVTALSKTLGCLRFVKCMNRVAHEAGNQFSNMMGWTTFFHSWLENGPLKDVFPDQQRKQNRVRCFRPLKVDRFGGAKQKKS